MSNLQAKLYDYGHGVAIFVKPKSGAMANATLGGQKFSYRVKP